MSPPPGLRKRKLFAPMRIAIGKNALTPRRPLCVWRLTRALGAASSPAVGRPAARRREQRAETIPGRQAGLEKPPGRVISPMRK